MTTEIQRYPIEMRSYPRVDAVIEMIVQWFEHRRQIAETCNCDPQELDRVAHELGVTARDIEGMVRRGRHSADELRDLLKVLHLDEATLARTQGFVLHDMERVCSECAFKRRCNEDLNDGTAAQHYTAYCGNADTLQSLGSRS